MSKKTFIVDCPHCNAKVGAEVSGIAEDVGTEYFSNEPYGRRLYVGKCPSCRSLLAGESHQIGFIESGDEFDEWSNVVRLYPNPKRIFSSHRIPNIVTSSLNEGDRSFYAGAYSAACVMFGRALEAICRDLLLSSSKTTTRRRIKNQQLSMSEDNKFPKKKIMLDQGIRQLKENKIIDERLYDWSQHLKAFRNIAAHPDDIFISRQDVEDLQTFVYAIAEYIYDLTDRYEKFKRRIEREKKKNK